jgi:hypothetical protein
MKNIPLFILLCCSNIFYSQYRELYSGVSLNNYRWSYSNSNLNNAGYETGFQIGVMSSPKLKLIRSIGKGFISPYASFEYNLSRFKLSTQDQTHLHAFRFSLPTRLRVMSFTKKKHSIFALVDPGVNLSFFQSNSNRSDLIPKINPVDLYINAGLGTTFQFAPKEVKKAGYKFSGLSVSASKYMPIGLIRTTQFSSTGFLDQLRFNIGLRFYYMEPKKEKKSVLKRLFGK